MSFNNRKRKASPSVVVVPAKRARNRTIYDTNPRLHAIMNRTSYVRAVKKGPPKSLDVQFSFDEYTAGSVLNGTYDISQDMSNTEYVYPINLVQSGAGSWNRVGRQVRLLSVQYKFMLTQTWAGNTDPQKLTKRPRTVRLVWVHDKAPSGTLPKKSDIFAFKNQGGTEASHALCGLNYDNMQRFKIIRDHIHVFSPEQNSMERVTGGNNANTLSNGSGIINTSVTSALVSGGDMRGRFVEGYIKLNIGTNYKSESNPMTIADISTGALYLIAMTTQGSEEDPGIGVAAFNGNVRLNYYDA